MFEPWVEPQPGLPGPREHFHQFSVASTVPVPRLATPMSSNKLFWCADNSPGALNTTSTPSSKPCYPTILIPVIGPAPGSAVIAMPAFSIVPDSASGPLP